MNKYINANKLLDEIERRLKDYWEISLHIVKEYNEDSNVRELKELLTLIDSLQQEAEDKRIKENKEAREAAIKYRDSVIQYIEQKRVLPSFKGKLLHSFKNELNTMEQILGIKNWSDIQYALFEKFALVFATWGGYHFHPKEIESEDSLQQEQQDMGEVSDGYHTFNELYYYRMLYNAAFFNLLPKKWVHKSKRHHTGEECFGGGWFIVMANLPSGQISNHYELKDWDLFKVPEKEFADEWDGHTPQEAAERLKRYLQQEQPEVNLGEITPSFAENMLCEFGVQSIEDMDSEILAEFARHFWNKGFNARKEE